MGVLGGHVDVSGVHQEPVFIWAFLLDLQWQDADGWSPVLYALWGVMFEDPCPPKGVHFLGGDVRGLGG